MKKRLYILKLRVFYGLILFLLVFNKILIHVIPFKKLIKIYSNISGKHTPSNDGIDSNRVRLVHNSIKKVQSKIKWQPKCFELSLTVLVLARLFKLPGSVYFGIARDEKETMAAHAWSQLGTYYITGYENMERFTTVYQVHYLPKGIAI